MCPVAGPFDVESCLIEHPAVAESGVIGKIRRYVLREQTK